MLVLHVGYGGWPPFVRWRGLCRNSLFLRGAVAVQNTLLPADALLGRGCGASSTALLLLVTRPRATGLYWVGGLGRGLASARRGHQRLQGLAGA